MFSCTITSYYTVNLSLKRMTPEDLLKLQVQEFNKGNVSFLMTLYEDDACFASEPGQVVKDLESIHQRLQRFIDMRAKLKARVKRVIQASDLALLITEWSINGTEPDGKPIISLEEVRWFCVSKNNEIPMALLGELS